MVLVRVVLRMTAVVVVVGEARPVMLSKLTLVKIIMKKVRSVRLRVVLRVTVVAVAVVIVEEVCSISLYVSLTLVTIIMKKSCSLRLGSW